MSKFTHDLMTKLNVKPEDIWLPAGGVAIAARTGSGKSTSFRKSKLIGRVIIADSGSMQHKLWFGEDQCAVISSLTKKSPIEQVMEEIERIEKDKVVGLLDSWSTLEQMQVAWFKRFASKSKGTERVTLPEHQQIVGDLRDLVLVLAAAPIFTLFNTTAGGSGKTPMGEICHYPAGALTGYPSLNGTEANKETILARWPSVWGMFAGHSKIGPRGFYTPSHDVRPEGYDRYVPLKDPYGVIVDNTDGKGIMAVPEVDKPENEERCFIDERLIEIAAKFPKRSAASTERPATNADAGQHPQQNPPQQVGAELLPEPVAAGLLKDLTDAGLDWEKIRKDAAPIIGRQLPGDASIRTLKLDEAEKLRSHCRKQKAARNTRPAAAA